MSSPSCLFTAHKSRILVELSSPSPDASPKGSVDVQILPLIDRLNQHDRVFTTSSCGGRVSVFLEGLKKDTKSNYSGESRQEGGTTTAGGTIGNAKMGGKGEGGKWLFVSHDMVDVERKSDQEVAKMLLGKSMDAAMEISSGEESVDLGLGSGNVTGFDISPITRFVHLKFEPMILHVQTSDLQTAHAILTAALSAGFRESGIMNPGLGSSFPMVAVRCNGLAMDSIIGIVDSSRGRITCLVDDVYLKTLVKICNLRFEDNKRRIDSFTTNIEDVLWGDKSGGKEIREDKEARKARKRNEGLKKQKELKALQFPGDEITENSTGEIFPDTGSAPFQETNVKKRLS